MGKKIIFKMPSALNISESSYNFLAKLQQTILASRDNSVIILDLTETNYIDAIFMAFIGGLDPLCDSQGKEIKYYALENSQLFRYFQRSGLYEYITQPQKSYINDNAIPFSRIDMNEISIVKYTDKILELAPITLSAAAEDYLWKNICEILNNSSDHSQATHGVYACGHWMPQKKHLVFSVYDTGIGIPTLIKQKINANFSSIEALKWALQLGNSTRQLENGVPRGLGLADLLKFINLNKGDLYILSNDVYYSCNNGYERFVTLDTKVVGTMISFIIVSDHEHIYVKNRRF